MRLTGRRLKGLGGIDVRPAGNSSDMYEERSNRLGNAHGIRSVYVDPTLQKIASKSSSSLGTAGRERPSSIQANSC